MARSSEILGLALIIVGLLVVGVVAAVVQGDDDDEVAGGTTTTIATTTTTEATTTTAPGATTTTEVDSGLANGGTGDAGGTDGTTPATGAGTLWLATGGLATLAAAGRLHRYTRNRPAGLERP